MCKNASSAAGKASLLQGQEYFKDDFQVFDFNLRPAVGHEFWNSHGAGACKQLRSHGYGGFCGSSED